MAEEKEMKNTAAAENTPAASNKNSDGARRRYRRRPAAKKPAAAEAPAVAEASNTQVPQQAKKTDGQGNAANTSKNNNANRGNNRRRNNTKPAAAKPTAETQPGAAQPLDNAAKPAAAPAQTARKNTRGPKPAGTAKTGENSNKNNGRPPQNRQPRAPKATGAVTAATSVPGARRGGKNDTRQANILPAAQSSAQPAASGRGNRRTMPQGNVPVRIIPLGGLGEVGKNMTLYECQGDMFLVDCGSLFPDSEMLGVDLVIPDYSYAVQNFDRIKGIVITHGHEDHTGALPYFLKQCKIPVYGTRLTLGLIENKLREHNLLGDVEMRLITPGQKFQLGCFEIDPLRVNHSIPDAIALAIHCPAGIILQTGDFKIDYTPVTDSPIDLTQFAAYGAKGVLALLSDSTNAERPGYSNSERVVGHSFEVLFGRADNKRIIIATFASNIQRIQQIFNMALKYDRKVAVSGRSMINNIGMALELGYLHAPSTLLIDIETINKYPPEKLVVVTTGSQGEPLSALSRMSGGMHRNVHIGVGDFVIFSSKPIPGNEKMVGKVVNSLLKQGADVIYESMYDVHTSGHACQEELKLMMSLVKPKYFIPVHGEYKQLKKHADLALGLGIAPDHIHIPDIGETIAVSEKGLTLEENVPSGKTLVDGLGIGDVGSVVLRDRQHLSQDGLVIVVATVDSVSGELLSGPDIVSRGFVYVRENESLIDDAKNCVHDVLYACWTDDIRDWGSVKSRIREEVSQLLYRRTKRSPMVLPILMEV